MLKGSLATGGGLEEGGFVVSLVFAVVSSSGAWEGGGPAVQIVTVPSIEPVASLGLDAP